MKRVVLAALLALSVACGGFINPAMVPDLVDLRANSGMLLTNYDLKGDSHKWVLDNLTKWAANHGIHVEFADTTEERVYGFTFCFGECMIVINNAETINSQASTLIHELTHAIMQEMDPDRAEVYAETVAMLVGERVGLDSSAQSLSYLYHHPVALHSGLLQRDQAKVNQIVDMLTKAARGQ